MKTVCWHAVVYEPDRDPCYAQCVEHDVGASGDTVLQAVNNLLELIPADVEHARRVGKDFLTSPWGAPARYAKAFEQSINLKTHTIQVGEDKILLTVGELEGIPD